MSIRTLLFAVFIACFTVPSLAAAQINTEAMRVGDPEEGFSGNVGASLDLKRGAVAYLELKGSTQNIYHYGVHTWLLSGNAGYGKTEGEKFAQRFFTHFRWTAMWHPRIGSELFTQVEYDEFLRQRLRSLLGSGPRVLVIDDETFQAFWGVAYMLEREILDIPPDNPHPQRGYYHRISSYLSLKWQPTENVNIVQTIYVQPRIDAFSDLRMLEQADLVVKLFDALSLKTSLTVLYDGRPPAGVVKTNLYLTQGVLLEY